MYRQLIWDAPHSNIQLNCNSAVPLGKSLAVRRCFALSKQVAIVIIRFNMLSHFLHSCIEGPLGRFI